VLALAVVLLLAVLGVGALIGRASVTRPVATPRVITVVHDVPVGAADTPAGALAADDNYVAIAAQSLEQDPALFATLLATTFTAAARATALTQATRARAADTTLMRNYADGGHALAVIAARRIDTYTPLRVTLTTWLGGFVWGPTFTPRQTWDLVNTTLVWRDGRWLTAAMNTQATPAPVPSIVYVDGNNNQSPAFNALNGMTAPFYGAG
jgi:hypothetical protein